MTSSVLVWTTETPPPAPRYPAVVDELVYVLCRVCWYERPAGQPCGLPCV